MYIKKANRKVHKHYTIEEKNQIVLLYLDHHMGVSEIVKVYDLCHNTRLYEWVKQYKRYGTCIDNRGKATKKDNPNKGRPKKDFTKPLSECSKEELIERVKLYEDLKKAVAYLKNSKQKKNIN